MTLALDPAIAAGLVLAVLRSAAFVMASPIFPRAIPVVGRVGLALALGLFFMSPLDGSMEVSRLLGAALVNIAVGIVLGFLTGLVFAMFSTAGGLIDMASGLGIAAVIDPNQGVQAAVFNRMFTMTALVVFMVVGGDALLVHGLALSVDAIPLGGGLALDQGVVAFAVEASRTMIVAAAELSIPVVAALFLSEVILGLASRFAPQSNVFILGLPLRILITLTTVSLVFVMFPTATDGAMRLLREAFVAGLRGLGVSG